MHLSSCGGNLRARPDFVVTSALLVKCRCAPYMAFTDSSMAARCHRFEATCVGFAGKRMSFTEIMITSGSHTMIKSHNSLLEFFPIGFAAPQRERKVAQQ